MPTTVLVTGATAGIGRLTALRLAHRGFLVFATGRNREALEALAREDARVVALPLDVTDARSLAAARDAVLARTAGRGLDAVVSNAGYALARPLEDVEPHELRAQLETNVVGAHAVARAFLPEMRARGAGRLVFVGSVAGRITMPLMGAYAASKHALVALADAYRRELHAFGIRVALVEPGFVRTGLAERSTRDLAAASRPGSAYARVCADAGRRGALVRLVEGDPESVARAIEAALTARSPQARYVITLHAHALLALQRLLPTSVADALLRAVTGFTRERLLGPAPAGAQEGERPEAPARAAAGRG